VTLEPADQHNVELAHFSWKFLIQKIGDLREEVIQAHQFIAELREAALQREAWESDTSQQLSNLKGELANNQGEIGSLRLDLHSMKWRLEQALESKAEHLEVRFSTKLRALAEQRALDIAAFGAYEESLRALDGRQSERDAAIQAVAEQDERRSAAQSALLEASLEALDARMTEEIVEVDKHHNTKREQESDWLRCAFEASYADQRSELARLSLDHKALADETRLGLRTADATAIAQLRASDAEQNEARKSLNACLREELQSSFEALRASLAAAVSQMEDNMTGLSTKHQQESTELRHSIDCLQRSVQQRSADASALERQVGRVLATPIMHQSLTAGRR